MTSIKIRIRSAREILFSPLRRTQNVLQPTPTEQLNFSWIRVQQCILCNGIHSWQIVYIARSVNYTNNRGNEPLHSVSFIELERYRFSTAATIDINPFNSGSFSNSLISGIKHVSEYQLQEITTGQNRRKEKLIRKLTRLH